MSEPCKQEPRLHQLEDEFGQMVRDIRDDQRRQTAYLQDIARQSVRLENLEAGQVRHENALNDLFNRSREYDKMPGAMAIRVLLILATFGSAVTSGFFVWLLTK